MAKSKKVGGAIASTTTIGCVDALRQARAKSQVELASDLHVGQPAVAKMELRADMYISNLRRYVEALRGESEITPRFANVSVTIKNFAELSAGEKAAQGGKSAPLATS